MYNFARFELILLKSDISHKTYFGIEKSKESALGSNLILKPLASKSW